MAQQEYIQPSLGIPILPTTWGYEQNTCSTGIENLRFTKKTTPTLHQAKKRPPSRVLSTLNQLHFQKKTWKKHGHPMMGRKKITRRLLNHSSSFRVPAAEKIFSTAIFEPTGIGKSSKKSAVDFCWKKTGNNLRKTTWVGRVFGWFPLGTPRFLGGILFCNFFGGEKKTAHRIFKRQP